MEMFAALRVVVYVQILCRWFLAQGFSASVLVEGFGGLFFG
jgi:hypothetical protein